MVEDEGKQEEKFDFTSEGEALERFPEGLLDAPFVSVGPTSSGQTIRCDESHSIIK